MRPRLLRLAVAPLFAMFFPSASGAQEAYRGQGVLLFLEGGVRRPGVGEVGTHLASQGFEEPGAFPTFGAALGFCVGRIHSELGFDLGAQTLRSRLTSAETSLEENGLRFDIGYAVLKARRHALFPFLGVALISHGVDPMPNVGPVSGRDERIVQQFGVLNLGVGFDRLVLDQGFRLVVGGRAGYSVGFDRSLWFEQKNADTREIEGATYLDGPKSSVNGVSLKVVVGVAL